MDIERFKALIEAYGSDADRWPELERAAALTFVEGSAEAHRLLEEEIALDRALDAVPTQSVSRTLEDRILATLPARGATRDVWWRSLAAQRWAPAAAVACSLVLGLLVGASLPGLVGITAGDADPALMAFNVVDTDILQELGGGS